MTIAERFLSLREALDITQAALGARAYPDLPLEQQRLRVTKVEGGHNQLSSHDSRAAFARAFGLSRKDFDAYLAGSLSLEETTRRIARTAAGGDAHVEYDEPGHGLGGSAFGRHPQFPEAVAAFERKYGRRFAAYPGLTDELRAMQFAKAPTILNAEVLLGFADALAKAKDEEAAVAEAPAAPPPPANDAPKKKPKRK